MATVEWAFLCDYAFVDAAGQASIIGIFESIGAPSLPVHFGQIYIALCLRLAPGDNFQLGASLTSPFGDELCKLHPRPVVARPNAPMKRVFPLGFYQVRFSEAGEHRFELFANENRLHAIALRVSLSLPPSGPLPASPK